MATLASKPRLRMAPAPSGFLHLGNVRTFLFDYLYARGQGGDLVLRIEDTDADRSSPEAEAYIIDSLTWLGIRWDEGPDVGGPRGPYRQSEREASHRRASQALLETGHAYECYCTPEELEGERREQQARGEAPRYSRRCYRLSSDEIQALRAEGRVPAIRFHVPERTDITWQDLVYGPINFKSDDIGDFIILRPNGAPIYNLANVVDDHDMEVTVGLRSQSHLSNTPRQIMLYNALDWPVPDFAHVPDVNDLQGRKMGKRYGAKAVIDYREEGYLPQAVVNYLALLGWSSQIDQEFLSMDDLIAQFSLDRVQKSNAAFDPARLEWFNAQYIRRLDIDDLIQAALPFLERSGLVSETGLDQVEVERLRQILPQVQERVRTLAEIPSMTDFFYRDEITLDPEEFKIKQRDHDQIAAALESTRVVLAQIDDWSIENIKACLYRHAETIGWKAGDLFMALRVAETGRRVTPPLIESMCILGKEASLRRIHQAIEVLRAKELV